ncbi:MAG: tetratricopeptide repeat protein [Thermoanaerobaculales bacterium]|jgi:predicted negative regulator of RcsB-dependent stress response|nr:tetratricopeptide repeat protein [Thermoanaerobaculales bacterium]
MARRITRKQLKQDDEFVSTVDTVMQWLADSWRPIAGVLAAIAVVAVGWWGVRGLMDSRADDASLALQHAIELYEGGSDAGQLEPAGDPAAAEAELLSVVEHYGSSDQADMARVYLARIHFDRGETEQARDLLIGLADRRRDDAIGRLATLDLVHLRIASGQATEVAADLEAMVVGSNPGLPRDVALYELGQLHLAEHNPDQARDYFSKLVEEFPESPYNRLARQRLGELG